MTTEEAKEYIEQDPFLNKKKFENRRRMAWYSFVTMVLMTFALFGISMMGTTGIAAISALTPILYMVYGVYTTVIAAYMGITAWSARDYLK